MRAEPPAAVAPRLSYVLVTDRYETIRRVLDHLRLQTVRQELEVILVVPAREALDDEAADLQGFAAVKVVEAGSPLVLGEWRAAGVRVASAPSVFIGETHSFPDERMAEVLLEAHAGPWTVVVPGFGNANPDGALPCAGFLSDYGAWLDTLPRGEIQFAPIYNVSYKRSFLLELGSRLGPALEHGDQMPIALRTREARILFEPAARIEHLNLSRTASWVRERYWAGLLIAGARTQRWSRARRLLYLSGSPLLPFLYLWRVRRGVDAVRGDPRTPAGTLPAMALGAVVKAAGELVGYARGAGEAADRQMTDHELFKASYVTGERR